MPGVATPQLLNYAEIVDVDLDATNDVNFADVEDYGHRVQIDVDKSALNNYLRWSRAVGSARPAAALDSTKESAFKDAINAGLSKSLVDIDGVTGGLHFGTANLDTNPDPRKRAAGVTANDIPLCFVLYKLYGSSSFATLDYIYNLNDAMGMLSNETVSTAIAESFKAQVSGSLDTMFRDLLAADPHRFFDASGIPEAGIFETNADVSGAGSWKLTDDDILEIKLKMIFHSRVTRRGVAGYEHNLTTTAVENQAASQANQQTVINPDDYFYIRLQLKVKDLGLADPAFLTYNGTKVTGYTGPLVNATLVIPSGVTAIAGDAFKNKTGLVSIVIPSSVTEIESGAFMGSGITGAVSLPGVKKIWYSAFANCSGITSVSAPSLELIRKAAFKNCTSLTSMNLSMAKDMFDSGELFQYCTSLTTIQLPSTPTNFSKIYDYTFDGCTALTTVNLPTSITEIGDAAFFNTKIGGVINLPNVTKIWANAFRNCINITGVNAPVLNMIRSGAFRSCTSLTSMDLSMTQDLSSINELFQNCTNLTSVQFPTNPTNFSKLSDYAFDGCSKLATLTLPSSVNTIGDGSCAQCTLLTSVVAPGVTIILANAFLNCINLSSVQFGTLTSIGSGAFQNTPALNPKPTV